MESRSLDQLSRETRGFIDALGNQRPVMDWSVSGQALQRDDGIYPHLLDGCLGHLTTRHLPFEQELREGFLGVRNS